MTTVERATATTGVLRFAQDDDGGTSNGKDNGKDNANYNYNYNYNGNCNCGGPSLRSG